MAGRQQQAELWLARIYDDTILTYTVACSWKKLGLTIKTCMAFAGCQIMCQRLMTALLIRIKFAIHTIEP